MFPVERRYLVKLSATGVAGDIAEVPWISEEPVQYLAANVFMPGGQDLPTGGIELVRNGEVLASTAFTGKTIIVPAYALDLGGGDLELGFLHPSNANRKKLDGIVTSDGSPGTSTVGAAPASQLVPALFTTLARITNGSANKVELIVQWSAIAWRNV